MITVAEATQLIAQTHRSYPAERVPLSAAKGRVLREPVRADRDFPPFDRVTMDGIAISYAGWQAGRRHFQVQGTQTAGSPPQQLLGPDACIEVMTGAVLPLGADTVIRYEDFEQQEGMAAVGAEGQVKQGQNVHPQGQDRSIGAELLSPGRLMGPPEIAVAASVGRAELLVTQHPTVAILSTGDELVPITATPLPQQIRRSNGSLLQATLAPYVAEAVSMHLEDDPMLIRQKVEETLRSYDLIVLSGGVSKGKADYIPGVMEELGVHKHFHRVAQRPGKPLWFGTWENETVIFALPGNPVSTFVGCVRYVLLWLRQSLGLAVKAPPMARLAQDFSFAPDLTYFLQVQAQPDGQGVWQAQPVAGHGSGDFANLLDANAFLELPQGREQFRAGESFSLWRW